MFIPVLLGAEVPEKSYVELLFLGNADRVVYLTARYKGNENWYQQYGLTPALLKLVVNKYAYYSKNGKSIYQNAGSIVADIRKESGVTLDTNKVSNAIGTMDLAMQSFAKKEPNHSLVKWWHTGLGVTGSAAAATATAAASGAKTVLQQTQKAVTAVKNGVSDTIESVVPWYLQPRTIIIGTATVAALYILLPKIAQGAVSGAVRGVREKSAQGAA